MLSVWRPYFVCIIPWRSGQPPQIGSVGPDRVNVIVAFVKAREGDEIAPWRPGRKIVRSRSQLCHGSIVQIDDSETIIRPAPKAKYDPLAVWGPTRKTDVSLSFD